MVSPGCRLIGVREGFAHQHLPATARSQPAASAQEQPVELRRSEVRQRPHHAAGRLIQRGNVQGDLHRDAGLDGGHAGDFLDARGEGVRGALHMDEHLGEAVGLVVFAAGGFQGIDQAARHDHHGQAAAHHHRDGEGLAFHPAQIAPELAVKVGDHYQFSELAGARCSFTRR